MVKLDVFDAKTDSEMTAPTVLIYQILQGIRYAGKRELPISNPDSETKREISIEMDDDKDTTLFNIHSPSVTKGHVIIMKDYDPKIFRDIRMFEKITPEDYDQAWRFDPTQIPQPDIGAGRSGSLFLLSADGRFIFKTIPHHEVESLRAILPQYREYIRANPDSRLMRFFALHRFQVANDFIYLFVGNNCFYSPRGLSVDKKYDLKGRKPKESSMKKDAIKQPAHGNIWKDNQLDRSFYPDNAMQLRLSLVKDAHFLASQDIIDYSLLVGVHFNDKKCNEILNFNRQVSTEAKHRVSIALEGKVDTPNSGTRDGNNLSVMPPVSKARTKRSYSFSITHHITGVGFPSAKEDNDEIYFFGIIDFLSRYYIKKKTANFFKKFLWEEQTLSTVPPATYCERFCNYVPSIIASAADNLNLSKTPALEMRSFDTGNLMSLRKIEMTDEKEFQVERKSSIMEEYTEPEG